MKSVGPRQLAHLPNCLSYMRSSFMPRVWLEVQLISGCDTVRRVGSRNSHNVHNACKADSRFGFANKLRTRMSVCDSQRLRLVVAFARLSGLTW